MRNGRTHEASSGLSEAVCDEGHSPAEVAHHEHILYHVAAPWGGNLHEGVGVDLVEAHETSVCMTPGGNRTPHHHSSLHPRIHCYNHSRRMHLAAGVDNPRAEDEGRTASWEVHAAAGTPWQAQWRVTL